MEQQSWIALAIGGVIGIASAVLTSSLNFIFGERAARRQRMQQLEDAQRLREEMLSDERRQYRRALEEREAEIILSFVDQVIDGMEQDIENIAWHYSDPERELEALTAQIDFWRTESWQFTHALVAASSMSDDIRRALAEFIGKYNTFKDTHSDHEARLEELKLKDDPQSSEQLLNVKAILRDQERPVLAAAGELRSKIRHYLSAGDW